MTMLRKVIHMILVLILLVAASGTTLSLHYCGQELVSAAINEEAPSCCDGNGGCCHNKDIHFEVKDDFVASPQIDVVKNIELDTLFPILYMVFSEVPMETESKVAYAFFDSSPPPKIQTRLSLLQTYIC